MRHRLRVPRRTFWHGGRGGEVVAGIALCCSAGRDEFSWAEGFGGGRDPRLNAAARPQLGTGA